MPGESLPDPTDCPECVGSLRGLLRNQRKRAAKPTRRVPYWDLPEVVAAEAAAAKAERAWLSGELRNYQLEARRCRLRIELHDVRAKLEAARRADLADVSLRGRATRERTVHLLEAEETVARDKLDKADDEKRIDVRALVTEWSRASQECQRVTMKARGVAT